MAVVSWRRSLASGAILVAIFGLVACGMDDSKSVQDESNESAYEYSLVKSIREDLEQHTDELELDIVAEFSIEDEDYLIVSGDDVNQELKGLLLAIEVQPLGTEPRALTTPYREDDELSALAREELERIQKRSRVVDYAIVELRDTSLVQYALQHGWGGASERWVSLGPTPIPLGNSFYIDVEGAPVEFTRNGLAQKIEGIMAWAGQSEDGGDATFVFMDGQLTGSFIWQGHSYSFQRLSDDEYAILRLEEVEDTDHPPLEWDEDIDQGSEGDLDLEAADIDSGPAEIRVLLLYSTSVFDRLDPKIASHSLLFVEQLNEVFRFRNTSDFVAQQLPVIFKMAGASALPEYIETPKYIEAYKRLVNAKTAIDLRKTHNADIVVLFIQKLAVRNRPLCGWANKLYHQPHEGYILVRHDCAENPSKLTLAHEIGHVVGAGHNQECNQNRIFGFGHGTFATKDGSQVRSIMACKAQCPISDAQCPKLPVWSSPRNYYREVQLGETNHSNNARVWIEGAYRVADFSD